MTEYAICFDFPETEGQPWFATRLNDGFGVTTSLAEAERFVDEAAADRTLKNGWGPAMAEFGIVVELAQ